MTDINETMDNAIIDDDFNKIESIALNPKNAYVKVHEFNMFTGHGRFINKWDDISNVFDDYFEDLNGDCQDYVMSLDKYKSMDYDAMIEDYDKPIEKRHDDDLKLFKDQINKNNKGVKI